VKVATLGVDGGSEYGGALLTADILGLNYSVRVA
jgi:hypothetical protein